MYLLKIFTINYERKNISKILVEIGELWSQKDENTKIIIIVLKL